MAGQIKKFVISLKRTPRRLEQFYASNERYNDIAPIEAIDGDNLTIEDLARNKLVSGAIEYKRGAIGCALSHRQLWLHAATNNTPVTVCEDDAELHDYFDDESQKLTDLADKDWDFILWGWNFRSILFAQSFPMLSPFLIRGSEDELRKNKLQYKKGATRSTLLVLRATYGIPCYSISAVGAQKFLAHCFPLRPIDFVIPELDMRVENNGIDCAMNSIYFPRSKSYVCFPPLALTDNDKSISTIGQR